MKAVSLSLSRLEGDLQIAEKAPGTIQQYLASIRSFEAFLGQGLDQASQDDIRRWVRATSRAPIASAFPSWCTRSEAAMNRQL